MTPHQGGFAEAVAKLEDLSHDRRWSEEEAGALTLAAEMLRPDPEPSPEISRPRHVCSGTTTDEQRVWAAAFAASMLEWMTIPSHAEAILAASGVAATETANKVLQGLRLAASARPDLVPKWLGVSAPAEEPER